MSSNPVSVYHVLISYLLFCWARDSCSFLNVKQEVAMNMVLQHCKKNASFQYCSAVLIPCRLYIIQILLDQFSNSFFSFLSPTKDFRIWFLILPWSFTAISHNIPTIYLSIQYKLAVLLQSACIYLSFLLPWAAPPSRMHFYTLFCL